MSIGDHTNIFEDGEITGFNPDADDDFYLLSDKIRDHNYLQQKIGDTLKYISANRDKDYFILYGGQVTDGGAGTVDIEEGAAIGKDSDGNVRVIYMEAQSAVSIPAGWKDDRQLWVIGKHDWKLDTGEGTRQHTNGESYHYQLNDSWVGEASSDDLFLDTDPGDTMVIWGSFKMSAGDVFTDMSFGERTRIWSTDAIGTIKMFDGAAWTDDVSMCGWYACIAANSTYGCPDMVSSFVMGDTFGNIGTTGGANAQTLVTANIAPHVHTIDHDHGSTWSGGESSHTHTVRQGQQMATGSSFTALKISGGTYGANTTGGSSHSHSVDLPNFTGNSGTLAAASSFENRPAFYSMLLIRRCY